MLPNNPSDQISEVDPPSGSKEEILAVTVGLNRKKDMVHLRRAAKEYL